MFNLTVRPAVALALTFILTNQASSESALSTQRLSAPNGFHWTSDSALWTSYETQHGTEYVFIDAAEKTIAPAFDHRLVAIALSASPPEGREPSSGEENNAAPPTHTKFTFKLNSLQRHPDDSVTFRADKHQWRWNPTTKTLTKLVAPVHSDDAPKPQNSLAALPAAKASAGNGEETHITFENRTDKTVALFWVKQNSELIAYGELNPSESHEQHTYGGHAWVVKEKSSGDFLACFQAKDQPALALIDGRKPQPEKRKQRRRPNKRSPNYEPFCKDHNLWIRDLRSGEEKQLSNDGTADKSYHRSVSQQRAVGMRYKMPDAPDTAVDVHWSPDTNYLLAIRTRVVPEPRVTLIESSPGDGKQPIVHSYPYFKPGDDLPVQELRLFRVDNGSEIKISNQWFPKPFRISDIRWDDDSSRFTFLYNQRGHQALRVLAVSSNDGTVTPLVNEESRTFVNYSGKMFRRDLHDSDEIIWMSERDGWNHLYLYDSRTGRVKHQITKGEWVVRSVDNVDAEKRQIHFQASGVYPDQDPYHIHHCRINFDGTEFTILTASDGMNDVEHGPGKQFLIATWSRSDQPREFDIRSAETGELCASLPPIKFEKGNLPERFAAKGRDGKTNIYGVIHLPHDFDASRKYPVIEYIYAGPHSAFVPKSFRKEPSRHIREMLARSYVVVQIDGMGTSHRSKAFHDVCWKNLKDGGFPDRIAWMRAAAKDRPYMDLTRVGIYGGSAGGQNACGAVLFHGDFYKVAVADCGCHDNRMDKLWWNEQWMGYPVGDHYAECSNVTNAHRLEGRLMLMVGELDRNVDPASTMQVAASLIKAGKDFELVVQPGKGHGSAESDYGRRRRAEFFDKHLN